MPVGDRALVTAVREAHLAAFLRGETIITPLELRAVVKASFEARDVELREAKALLRECKPLLRRLVMTFRIDGTPDVGELLRRIDQASKEP